MTKQQTQEYENFVYVRKKRRGAGEEEEEGSKELNIVPYLDIVMNLIIFLLVAQSTMVALGLIDISAPTYAAPGAGGGATPDKPPKPPLRLAIGVSHDGFYVAAAGGVLPGETPPDPNAVGEDGIQKRAPSIPKRNGKYDYKGLRAKLKGIKAAFPHESSFFLSADANVPYDVIVRVLDYTRDDGKGGKLFPRVAFSEIN